MQMKERLSAVVIFEDLETTGNQYEEDQHWTPELVE